MYYYVCDLFFFFFFFFQAEDGIRDGHVTGVQTCALPIYRPAPVGRARRAAQHRDRSRAAPPSRLERSARARPRAGHRSEEHTSELQSRGQLVCRLLLEKKNTDMQHSCEATKLHFNAASAN